MTSKAKLVFQFDDDEPIATIDISEKSVALEFVRTEEDPEPGMEFSDGKGKTFKIYIKNNDNN